MKKNAKRILSLLLVLMMFLSLMPTALAAEAETVPYEDEGYGSSWSDWDDQPAEEIPAEEPAEEFVEEPVEEPAEVIAEEPAAEPTIELVEEPAPVVEPVDAEEPVVSFPANTFFYVGGSGLRVTVEAPEGAFPEDADMTVTEKALDEVQAQIDQSDFAGQVAVVAADISFADSEGNELQPNVPVRVYMSDPYITEVEDPTVLHIADDGEITQVGGPAADLRLEEPVAALNAMGSIQSATASVNAVSEPAASGKASSSLSLSFEASSFSTYAISWNYGYYSYNIHYVDTNGRSLTPSRTPTFTSSPMFLIYDIEGYEYDSCHYGSLTGTAITPLLRSNNGDRQYYNGSGWSNLRSDIYVVYKAKTAPTAGGTVKPPEDQTWPEGDDTPQFSKDSKNNGDGTNTVSLKIAAAEKQVENKVRANVIVVFDRSGSMAYNMSGSQTSGVPSAQQRITIAKSAVNTMATTLTTGDKAGLVDLALVEFSTAAARRGTWTSNATTYANNTYVGGMTASGGTNWEQGLAVANRISNNDSNAATFIIFVTDGDPTFRESRGNYADGDLDMWNGSTYTYYRSNQVFGSGTGTLAQNNNQRNFDAAVVEAKSILAANKNLYVIGVSNDASSVKSFATSAGVKADNAFLATDAAALNEAFDSIVSSISAALGFGDVSINDGITELSNTEMEVMEEVDPDSFTYWITDNTGRHEWTTREADGCGAASYNEETGTVQWNMGAGFQLQDGVTYEVTFTVWPSIEANQLVADLNNGDKTFDGLTEAEKAQVVELNTTPVTYALKTNTDQVNATYKKTTKTGDVVTVSDNTPITATYHEGTIENMGLNAMQLLIKKVFNDTLTDAEDREKEVTLVLKRRPTGEGEFVDFPVTQGSTQSANIVLNEANNWTYSVYVAPGLESSGIIREKGYEFTLSEPDIDYHYELNEEIVNPMMVNTTPTYRGDGNHDQALTAENAVKGGIDVRKVLVDANGNEILTEEEFTITGSILDADGNPYLWAEGDDVNATGAYHKYDKDGNRTIYKGHFPSTANITLTLKPGEYVRFINVPDGSTYSFTETISAAQAADGYSLDKLEGANYVAVLDADGNVVKDADDNIVYEVTSDYDAPAVSGATVTGTVHSNVSSRLTYTNKTEKGEAFYVYHSSDNSIEKVFANDARVTVGEYNESTKSYTYTFNIVKEVKDGTMYGGYFATTVKTTGEGESATSVTYKGYKGAALSDEEIRELAYTEKSGTTATTYDGDHTGGFWASDAAGKAYGVDAASASQWLNGAVQTVNGKAMNPVANGVYYLKEVPEDFFVPSLYYVYDTRSENQEVKKLYLMVPADDGLYQYVCGTPISLSQGKRLYASFKATSFDGTEKTFTALDANSNLGRGFLVVWDEAAKIVANSSYEWTPTYVTKDGVEIGAAGKRTFAFDDTLGFDYFKANYSDEKVDSAILN